MSVLVPLQAWNPSSSLAGVCPPAYHVSGEEAECGALLEVVGLVFADGVLVHLAKP